MKIDRINEDLIYRYKLEKGISNVKGGIKVLCDLKYPTEILENTKHYLDKVCL